MKLTVFIILILSSCGSIFLTNSAKRNYYHNKYSNELGKGDIRIIVTSEFDSNDVVKIYEGDSLIYQCKGSNSGLRYVSGGTNYHTNKDTFFIKASLNDSINFIYRVAVKSKLIELAVRKKENDTILIEECPPVRIFHH